MLDDDQCDCVQSDRGCEQQRRDDQSADARYGAGECKCPFEQREPGLYEQG
jgi:hypothetical protein